MKTCSRCKISKETSEFHIKHGDRLQSHCKGCQRLYGQKHYLENTQYYIQKGARLRQARIEWFREYKKTLKCELCGENHPATLDFNHRNPSEKEFNVGEMVAVQGKARILKEIAKCQILCSNCHRIYHWNEIHN